MSETLCTLRTKGGGGGKYTETSLWTNSSPSSAFAAQTVTLSDSISNYKYVAICYKYAGTTDGVNDPMSVIVPVDKFKTSLKNNSTRHNILVLGVETNGNAGWTRNVFYASDTTIEFDTGYRQNAASSSGDICVPTEILGLNELDHAKGFDETVLWTNSAPTTGASSFTCTLSDDWTNYDYIKVSACLSTSSPTNVLSTMFAKDELAKCRTVSGTNSFNISLTLYLGSGGFYCRRGTANVANNATISFGQASQLGGTGTNSNYLIPVSIAGCKFR